MAEYIEREAAKKKHCEICWEKCICYRSKPTCDELKAFDLIPAADVRPVVRARWEYNPGDNIPYCSECMMPQDSECNFCPNCGAMMEES